MSIKFVLKRNSQSSRTTDNPVIAEHFFDGNLFTVGSDSVNNLIIEESASEQAVVVREGEQITLINSAEGTRLNGEMLRREAIQVLEEGDKIEIGSYLILVANAAEPPVDIYATTQNTPVDVYTTNENTPVDIYATTKFNMSEIAETPREPPIESPREPAQAAETRDTAAESKEPPTRNFADILDTLRTEDDSFYFVVKNNLQEVGRILLEQPEIPIGTGGRGEIPTTVENISTVCAVVRKDWSGILIESQKRNAVSVNGETIKTPQRLRHEDLVTLSGAPKFSLVLHEPSSLVALESLLSTRNSSGDLRGGLRGWNKQSLDQSVVSEPAEKVSFLERRYFRHFSFFEIVSMVIGTLIGAVLIFLLLEFLFS